MRFAAYVLMIGLLGIALYTGDIALALAAGGAKALLVGVEFMELRHAARAHLVGFALFTIALTGGLVALTA